MNRQPLEGLIIYGIKEVYELFRQSYVSKGKYRLPIWIGYNKSSKKEITVIPLEQRDEQIKIDLISLFQNEERFQFIESRAKDGITFVFLDVLPSEFESIYLNLPVVSTSQNIVKNDKDDSQVIIPVQNDKRHKQKEQSHLITRAAWAGVLLLFFACVISTYFAPKLFTQYPQPTNTNEIVSAASSTLLPVITETHTQSSLTTDNVVQSPISTNTIVQITPLPNTLTLTPSIVPPSDTLTPTLSITSAIGSIKTETATIIPTRTGLPTELNLCVTSNIGLKIRSLPSTGSDKIGTLELKECRWYNAKFEIKNNKGEVVETWVHISPNQSLKNIIGGWVSYEYLTKGNLEVLESITSNPEIGYVNTSTPTPTSTSAP